MLHLLLLLQFAARLDESGLRSVGVVDELEHTRLCQRSVPVDNSFEAPHSR